MKSDTERKRYHTEKMHKRKNRLHVHLSKELRGKLKAKKRAVGVRKGDTVRVMRGPGKGKEAKVSDVNVLRRKVMLEGIVAKNARGREVPLPLEPSNLLLLSLESTEERKQIFTEEAFRKKEQKKEAPKAEAKPDGQAHGQGKSEEAKVAHQKEHKAHEAAAAHKHERASEHKAHAHK